MKDPDRRTSARRRVGDASPTGTMDLLAGVTPPSAELVVGKVGEVCDGPRGDRTASTTAQVERCKQEPTEPGLCHGDGPSSPPLGTFESLMARVAARRELFDAVMAPLAGASDGDLELLAAFVRLPDWRDRAR
jgi:hypothetical protein